MNEYGNGGFYFDQEKANVDALKLEIAKTKDPETKENLERLLEEAESKYTKHNRVRNVLIGLFLLVFLLIGGIVVKMFFTVGSEMF